MFANQHTLAKSHVQMRWTTARVPVLIGPQIPRAHRHDTRERYCRAILTLFRPWHTFHDLCNVDETWHDALSVHSKDFLESSKQIIENIELLHECKIDRDENLVQMINDERDSDAHTALHRISDVTTDADIGEENLLELLDLLQTHSDQSTNKSSDGASSNEEQVYIENAIGCVIETERFVPYVDQKSKTDFHRDTQHSTCIGQSSSCLDPCHCIASNADITLNTQWQITIKEARKKIREGILNGNEEQSDCNHNMSSCDEVVTCVSKDMQIVADIECITSDHVEDVALMSRTIYSSKMISEEYRLNTEQNRAFMIITDHLDRKNPTGTSIVFESITR